LLIRGGRAANMLSFERIHISLEVLDLAVADSLGCRGIT
jgi:hypothetical protein